jgi:hypothetical protein
MNWLLRLKTQAVHSGEPTKPAKPSNVGFVGATDALFQKTRRTASAANDPAHDVGRWCWPRSTAMNSSEIEAFTERIARFTAKGLALDEAEALVDGLTIRDRETDDRCVCLECLHLAGYGPWRCSNWQKAGISTTARDAQLPRDFVHQLQRCDGFKAY